MIAYFVSKLPCVKAGIFASAMSTPIAFIIDNEWVMRAIVILGSGGIAAIMVAWGRLRTATASAHKIEADVISSQFVLVVERLQKENEVLSDRLEVSAQREAIITVSKHDALKENQAMIFFIQNLTEILCEHNLTCPRPVTLPQFKFTSLSEILKAEDIARTKFAEGMIPIKTSMAVT